MLGLRNYVTWFEKKIPRALTPSRQVSWLEQEALEQAEWVDGIADTYLRIPIVNRRINSES